MSDLRQLGYLIDEMQSKSDARLLSEYAEIGSESAFTELVARHTDLVYSAALRQVPSSDLACDVAQNVFTILARSARVLAGKLEPEASLAGWLCRCTRNLALNLRRDDFRRHVRERQAMEILQPSPEAAPDWDRLHPLLDEAISRLNENDHDALVLRYFKNQNLRAVGLALGVSDDTAQKRISRALEKLREYLMHRGVTTTGAALAMTISAHAVQAAPAGLAASISTVAAVAGTTLATTASAAAIKTIAMTTLQKTLITASVALLAGVGIYEARQASLSRGQIRTLQQQQAPLAQQIQQLQSERDSLANRLSALADGIEKGKSSSVELLKLRAEVTRLRGDSQELAQLKAAEANDPAQTELKTWLAHVKQLKHEAETNPRARIPEFSLLTEQDWLDRAKYYGNRPQLDAATDLRVAMAELRQSAQNRFADLAQPALIRYAQDHDGRFPTDLAQFKPYLGIAVNGRSVDDTILQRYQIEPAEKFHMNAAGQDWVITPKELVDGEYDHLIAIGPASWGYQQTQAEKLIALQKAIELQKTIELQNSRDTQTNK